MTENEDLKDTEVNLLRKEQFMINSKFSLLSFALNEPEAKFNEFEPRLKFKTRLYMVGST